MAISMTEVSAQFSEMSSLRVEIHRDKHFNGKYVQLWALTILDGPNTVTRSHSFYHDSEMNGFLQCPETSFVRHPGAVWIFVGYSSIYLSFLFVFLLRASPTVGEDYTSVAPSFPYLKPVCHWEVVLGSFQAPRLCCRHQRTQLKHFLLLLLILGGGRRLMSDSSSPSQSSAPYPVATKKSGVIIGAHSSCCCHIRLTSKCPQGLQQGGIPHTAFQICHLPFRIRWWRCWVTAADT